MTVLEVLSNNDGRWTKKQLAARIYRCACKGDTCADKRAVEDEIRRLIIEEGRWIVSSGAGYWLTDDIAEVERYIASLEHRRDSLTERVQALRKAVEASRVTSEQFHLWDAA